MRHSNALGARQRPVDRHTLVGVNERVEGHPEKDVAPSGSAHVPEVVPGVGNPPDLIPEAVAPLVDVQGALGRDGVLRGHLSLLDCLRAGEGLAGGAEADGEAVVRSTEAKFSVGLRAVDHGAPASTCHESTDESSEMLLKLYLVNTRTVSWMGDAV